MTKTLLNGYQREPRDDHNWELGSCSKQEKCLMCCFVMKSVFMVLVGWGGCVGGFIRHLFVNVSVFC